MMGPSTNDDDDDDHDMIGSTGTKASSTPSIMILQAETFFETNEDDATAFCETRIEQLQKKLDKLKEEDQDILSQQADLKKLLYGRFGKSINLEDDWNLEINIDLLKIIYLYTLSGQPVVWIRPSAKAKSANLL